jgi:uracil-DNA glycosylase
MLNQEFDKPYFRQLAAFLKLEKKRGKTIFPPGNQIFAALDLIPFDQVKVVIIGQDPYHGTGQAHGLCFSVPDGVSPPPSLINIFKEIKDDLGHPVPPSGSLISWAKQGVLLLNAILTVEKGLAGSHQNKGWELFTDVIIKQLSNNREHLVFMLWGAFARQKGAVVDAERHLVLRCGHPSPLSAGKGHWFGNKHFSQANEYLKKHGITPVNWNLN